MVTVTVLLSILLLLLLVILPLTFTMACLMGAWIYHSGRGMTTPLPALRRPAEISGGNTGAGEPVKPIRT